MGAALLSIRCASPPDPQAESAYAGSAGSAQVLCPARPDEAALAFSSRTVELSMAFGEVASQEIHLVGKLAAVAKLRVSTVTPPGPDVAILSAEEGRPSGVRITAFGAQVGHTAGQVTVSTGIEAPRELTLLYSWNVSGNVTVDPTNPFIDLRTPVPGVVINVKSSRKDFRLTAAEIPAGPFVATVERAEEARGEYIVHVTANTVRSNNPDQRGFLGKLRLVSNDPAEPSKDVPLFALGRLPR